MRYISRFAVLIKRVGLLALTLLVIFLVIQAYSALLPNVWYRDHLAISIIALWILTAYFVLPRVHRFLSKIYLPAYFAGRVRTADGLLSDPVNLAINGNKKALINSMRKAGWKKADRITLKTSWRIIYSSIFRKSYPNAPVSDLFLFGRKQDIAFQKEVNNNPRKRHHVRFWQTPQDWYLPGGYKVDWIGAATYDSAVGFSLFTMQITHHIDYNVDKERDFIIKTLRDARALKSSTKIKHYFNAYKTRNGGGNRYITDGSFVIADLIGRSSTRWARTTQHSNLESIQEELYNLKQAQNRTPIKPEDQIKQAEQLIKEIKQKLKKKSNQKQIKNKGIDLLISTILLHQAIDADISKSYRERVDEYWEPHQKGD